MAEEVRDEWALGIELHPVRGPPPIGTPSEHAGEEAAGKAKSRGKRDRNRTRTSNLGPIIRYELRDGENKSLPLPGAPWDPNNPGPDTESRLAQLTAAEEAGSSLGENDGPLDPASFIEEQTKGTSQLSAQEQARAKETKAAQAHDAYRLGHRKETSAARIQAVMKGRQARLKMEAFTIDKEDGGAAVASGEGLDASCRGVTTVPSEADSKNRFDAAPRERRGADEARPNAPSQMAGMAGTRGASSALSGHDLLEQLEQQRLDLQATYARANQFLSQQRERLALSEEAAGEARDRVQAIEATLAGFNLDAIATPAGTTALPLRGKAPGDAEY